MNCLKSCNTLKNTFYQVKLDIFHPGELLPFTIVHTRAVVVAQLVEWSLLTPKIRGSNPAIGQVLYTKFLPIAINVEKTKIKKIDREWPIF